MKFKLTWTPTTSNSVSLGFDSGGEGVGIGLGGLSVVGAYVTISSPDSTLHNWQFGYVQNVLTGKSTWIYGTERPATKTEKNMRFQCLDQEKGRADFFFNAPAKALSTNNLQVYLPQFKDYPRLFGKANFSQVSGASRFALWVMAYNTATKKNIVLGHQYWTIVYRIKPNPDSEDAVITSPDTGVTLLHRDAIIPSPSIRLDGPLANSGSAQQIDNFVWEHNSWQKDLRSDSSSSESEEESEDGSSDDDSLSDLETETIDASTLEIPPGLRGLGPLTGKKRK
ncbi:hypothetical protein [Pseudomonas sp. GM18]|uniref:hypothetical protein n=1 Tax=Pseudomonas sp. GM18 TaxID=1144324 RepID=UPI0012F8638A|nr:hypothetical protein [Pseudomonas sp. GM18]